MPVEEGALLHRDGQEAAMVDFRLLIENAYLVAHLLRYKIHPHGNITGGEIQ